MLRELYIENVAVIEKADVDFSDGFNVLTGETGAGKSIVIDSINAILGNRTSKEIVRSGADKAVIYAVFENVDQKTVERLAVEGYDCDGSLMLWREITTDGKSRCKINGRPSTASTVREICSSLINIHGQHDNQDLLNPERHINILDRFAADDDLLIDFQNSYSRMIDLKTKLSKLNIDDSEKERRLDLLRYQVDEIDKAELDPGEEEGLASTRNLIRNSEKIAELLGQVNAALDGIEGESVGASELLGAAAEAMSALSSISSDFSELSTKLNDAYYSVGDLSNEASEYLSKFVFDKSSLAEIEERLDVIFRLKRKYGDSIEAVLGFCEKARIELESIEKSDETREALESALREAAAEAEKKAAILSAARDRGKKLFVKRIKDEFAFLNMPNSIFEVSQSKSELWSMGCDKIEFLLSANPGEAPKPLSRIASGGELSRIMLAIKSAMAEKDNIPTLIFDEIDSGVSGASAQKVGKKLREVSRSRQTLCVTHSAQIAAFAAVHLFIQKTVSGGRTYTSIKTLGNKERVKELARIISGDNITDTALSNAAEMLLLAEN